MTHGATIIAGSSTMTVDGKAVARLGDLVDCPIHGINPIDAGCSTLQTADGKAVAIVGSVAQCGAMVTGGSPDMTVV